MLTDEGSVGLAVPRDRDGTFEPALVPKGVTRLAGFDGQIISLYARGLSVREVQAHLRQMYQIEVSPDLIGRVTDAVHEDVLAWRNRPLEPVYPVVFLDALRVKIRHDGVVKNKAIYVALALTLSGEKAVLGLWVEQTEGARFWARRAERTEDPRRRGHPDRGGRWAEGVPRGDRDGVPADDDADRHRAPDPQLAGGGVMEGPQSLDAVAEGDLPGTGGRRAAEAALDAFEAGPWGQRYPMIAPMWRRAWAYVVPFFAFPPAIRKMIYTTNAVESLNRSLRKVIKTRGSFPSDEAALKLLYLAIQHAGMRWKPAITWPEAKLQFMILFGHRIARSAS